MTVVFATKAQLQIVQDLAHQIWFSTYSTIISIDQIHYMLDLMYSIASLEKQLLVQKHQFLLLQQDNLFYGYAAYELNYNNSTKTKLHKLYVLPQKQGAGLGKLLLSEIEKNAKEANNTALILNVNRHNKAKDFYLKNQFQITDTIDLGIGKGYLMEDYIMEKLL